MSRNISKDMRDMIEAEEETVDYSNYTLGDEEEEYIYEELPEEPGCTVPFLSIILFALSLPLTWMLVHV